MLVTFNALARGSKKDNLTKRGMRLNLKRVAANNVYVNCAPSLKALRALSEILVAWFHYRVKTPAECREPHAPCELGE
jgi:hypothetical protein